MQRQGRAVPDELPRRAAAPARLLCPAPDVCRNEGYGLSCHAAVLPAMLRVFPHGALPSK
jgi:hypothetical protein